MFRMPTVYRQSTLVKITKLVDRGCRRARKRFMSFIASSKCRRRQAGRIMFAANASIGRGVWHDEYPEGPIVDVSRDPNLCNIESLNRVQGTRGWEAAKEKSFRLFGEMQSIELLYCQQQKAYAPAQVLAGSS